MHDDDPEQGVPGAQLAQPLPHHRGWAHDQGGPELPAVVQPCQESRHLHSEQSLAFGSFPTNSRTIMSSTWVVVALRCACFMVGVLQRGCRGGCGSAETPAFRVQLRQCLALQHACQGDCSSEESSGCGAALPEKLLPAQ